MKRILLFLVGISFVTCNTAELEKLKLDNATLETNYNEVVFELEECQNGADKISANVTKSYNEKQYELAKFNIELLSEKHPESPDNKKFQKLLPKINREIEKIEQKKEAAAKEKLRLENLKNTGMWSVRRFVDDFGETTGKGYITNSSNLSGLFSNSATHNSDLNIDFLIISSSKISFMLYEYARNNPVKSSYSTTYYTVQIQDKDGVRSRLTAKNYSDRLTFGPSHSKKVHNALKKGGIVKFSLYETDTPQTKYEFTISNADWYDNAYEKLTSKK